MVYKVTTAGKAYLTKDWVQFMEDRKGQSFKVTIPKGITDGRISRAEKVSGDWGNSRSVLR